MNWEVKTVFAPYTAEQDKLLNAACEGEWEPYHVEGSFHYFKREKKERPGEKISPPAVSAPVFTPANTPLPKDKNAGAANNKNQRRK
jgi:hypothetical protein